MFDTLNWQPPGREVLKGRANVLKKIRSYFETKGVLEVNTPVLSLATTPDPSITSVQASLNKTPLGDTLPVYMHTSPEFAMKRLLVEGSGDIYQICQVFRDSDFSPVHNAEFTMLEWYRLGIDHRQLMDELFELIAIVADKPLQRVDYSYQSLFEKYIGFNPHQISLHECQCWCEQHAVSYPEGLSGIDAFLDLILSFVIQPEFSEQQITFVYDYPFSQAALAKVRNESVPLASRFEMYWGNIELANGFHELQDAREQRQRFTEENQRRNIPVPLDEAFLSDLAKGLPDCSGVALGLSRLFLKLGLV